MALACHVSRSSAAWRCQLKSIAARISEQVWLTARQPHASLLVMLEGVVVLAARDATVTDFFVGRLAARPSVVRVILAWVVIVIDLSEWRFDTILY
jgi:hypothetical protein